jgi:hypothetical protein
LGSGLAADLAIADDNYVPTAACSRFFTHPIAVRRRLAAVAIVLSCGAGSAPWARAEEAVGGAKLPQIEVESQSAVTVIGSSESLRAVITALCETSGVELRSYRAPDRPISARYEGAPLRHVLERLLRRESFMLGFSAPAGEGAAEIAWLSVIGTDAAAAPVVASGAPAAPSADPPPGSGSIFPIALIDSDNVGVRANAAKVYARRLDDEAKLRQQLLGGSVQELASQLSGHRFAREFLQTVRTSVRNPEARVKINSLLSRVR